MYDYARGLFNLGLLHLHGGRRNDERSRRGASQSEKNPVLIHYHIFKNAGTSFEWALQQNFGKRFKRFDKETPGATLSAEECIEFLSSAPEAVAISSHQLMLPPPRVPRRRVYTSILIRDPIARIRSIYAFERRQNEKTPGAIKAKELSFKDYVDWRLSTSPAMLCNYQVYFLARGKNLRRPATVDSEDMQRAIANLDRVDIVGTVERYEEWLALAQSILSTSFPGTELSVSRQNVTSENSTNAAIFDDLVEDLGHEMAQRLLESNELDMCLHQVADGLLTRRLGECGVKVTLREIYTNVQHYRSQKSTIESKGHG